MTQHDYDLANQNGASFRSDGNNLFEAIASLNSGATEPSVKFPNMSWMDDASLILKIRNSANTAWINVAQKNGSTWIPYRDGVLLGTAAILASTAVLQAANDLSDLADAATARTNLGLATVAQAEAEAGTATTARAWTAQRVKQAIAALASAGGGLKSRQIFTADGTWTRPAGITLIRLKMIGASGGGGGSTGGNDGGRGGHSRLAEALIDVSATASAAVTIGAGGAGGNRSRGGSAGGATSLGSLMDITGGGGGGGGATISTPARQVQRVWPPETISTKT